MGVELLVHWEKLFLNIYHEKLLLPLSIILPILTEFCCSLNHVMTAKAAAACLARYSSTNNAHVMQELECLLLLIGIMFNNKLNSTSTCGAVFPV